MKKGKLYSSPHMETRDGKNAIFTKIVMCTKDSSAESKRFEGVLVFNDDPTSSLPQGDYSQGWIKSSFVEYPENRGVIIFSKEAKEIGECQG